MKQSFTDFQIIFVDNNSGDGSVEFIKENYPSENIKIIISDKNLGFAGGNNLGFKHCEGEYIVLLNNDTAVDKDWLKNLIDCISADEGIGMAQSLVLTEGIPGRYYKKNGTVNLLGHNIMEIFEIGKNGLGEIFLAGGCSSIIRRSLADALNGLFLDEYFAYSEDTYLCFKVKFRGLKICHTSKSIVHHKGGGTSANRKASHLYFYQERNRLLNFLLFFPNSFLIKYIPYLMFNFVLKITASAVSPKYSADGLIKAYLWLLTSQKWIRENRASLNEIKLTDDNYVLNYLSGKLFNGDNVFGKVMNLFSISYCKITGIKIIENK